MDKIYKQRRTCNISRDKIFAYFIGVIGLFGMIFTCIQTQVKQFPHSDILYIDRETLNIEKGSQYAVLLKRAERKDSQTEISQEKKVFESNMLNKGVYEANIPMENIQNNGHFDSVHNGIAHDDDIIRSVDKTLKPLVDVDNAFKHRIENKRNLQQKVIDKLLNTEREIKDNHNMTDFSINDVDHKQTKEKQIKYHKKLMNKNSKNIHKGNSFIKQPNIEATGRGSDKYNTRYTFNNSSDKHRAYDFVIYKTALKSIFNVNRKATLKPCANLFNNKKSDLIEANLYINRHKRIPIPNERYLNLTKDCEQFKLDRGYFGTPFTETEQTFPLFYSILAFRSIEQIERLLRSIYRPQNYYCIHMDAKANSDDLKTIKAIANCFVNVNMASKSIDVKWGQFSVLDAELVCMKDSWRYRDWKYYINLTGQEFPLKTNLEIVQILRAMKGANVVDGTWVRARENYFYRWLKSGTAPPHGIRPTKGSVHIVVNRDFVDFVLHDRRSLDFLLWLNTTDIPDETFFSTLNHNPQLGIPGSFLGEAEEYPKKPTFTRYKNWEMGHGVWVRQCSGKYVHNICILGVGDLHRLKDDIALFANKFYINFQYLTYDCMEELIYERTKDQYLNEREIDVTFYELLDQVRLRLVK